MAMVYESIAIGTPQRFMEVAGLFHELVVLGTSKVLQILYKDTTAPRFPKQFFQQTPLCTSLVADKKTIAVSHVILSPELMDHGFDGLFHVTDVEKMICK